jgi:hypothetical protein
MFCLGLQHHLGRSGGRGGGGRGSTPKKAELLNQLQEMPSHKLDDTNPAHFVILVDRFVAVLVTTAAGFLVFDLGRRIRRGLRHTRRYPKSKLTQTINHTTYVFGCLGFLLGLCECITFGLH